MNRLEPLPDCYRIIAQSDDPQKVFFHSPSVLPLPGGRLLAAAGCGHLKCSGSQEKQVGAAAACRKAEGRIFVSDDKGDAWRQTAELLFAPLCLFLSGESVYAMGQCGDLMIARSDDQGETWSAAAPLTSGQCWRQSPSNVWYANENIYIAMERAEEQKGEFAPILMRAAVGSDLLRAESWTFASALTFSDVVEREELLHYHGIPFERMEDENRSAKALTWCGGQVTQFLDPGDIWTDPSGHTFHLYLQTNSGIGSMGAMLKVQENPDGSMTTGVEKAPSGKTALFAAIPGAYSEFHILHDRKTGYYWLAANQATACPEPARTEEERRMVPDSQKNRLVLYFSKNSFDWCFAGIVSIVESGKESCSCASMAIEEDDLLIAAQYMGGHAEKGSFVSRVELYRIEQFRRYIY